MTKQNYVVIISAQHKRIWVAVETNTDSVIDELQDKKLFKTNTFKIRWKDLWNSSERQRSRVPVVKIDEAAEESCSVREGRGRQKDWQVEKQMRKRNGIKLGEILQKIARIQWLPPIASRCNFDVIWRTRIKQHHLSDMISHHLISHFNSQLLWFSS